MTHTTRRVEEPGLSGARTSVRTWLTADAVLTGLNGLVYLLAAGPLEDLLGADAATFRLVGAFLLVFTAFVGWAARTADRGGTAITVVVAVNVLWVLASLMVAATDTLDLTTVGRVWAVAQGAVVGVVTALQVRTGWPRSH